MNSRIATLADNSELASFCCCPDGGPAWAKETENYIRAASLRQAEKVLLLHDDDGELVGVSAFDTRMIDVVPVLEPVEVRGWHLHAMAIRLDDQRQGLCGELFVQTFDAMYGQDRTRSLVTANVHEENHPSIKACAKAGLELLRPNGDGYNLLLAVVPRTKLPDGLE
ncbi:MAG TPA: GNAT family protein [Solirubrobacterales bacterium]|jgi:RimJ/RimL family protein N-acetyltransferase